MTEAEKEESEKKKISIISVSGGMIWAIASIVLGSYLGTAGTLYGAALGSGAGTVWGVWYENFATRALVKLKAKKKQEDAEAQAISPAGRERLGRNREMLTREIERDYLSQRNPWKTAFFATAAAGACFLITVAGVLTVEAATGRTLHSNLTGAKQYGTSFSYSTVAPKPQIVSPPPSSVTASPDTSPSSSPSATISASPDTSPSVSPDMTPGGTSSVIPVPTGTPTSLVSLAPLPSGETAPAGR